MTLDINALLPFLPERWRPLVVATLGAVAASQVLAAQIVARLPSSAANHPTWGRLVHTLHWYSHVRFFDEMGTVKPPFSNAPASPPVQP